MGAECAGAANTPAEVKTQCSETLTRLTAPAATTAAAAQPTPNPLNPLGGIGNMFNNETRGVQNAVTPH